MTNPSEDFLEFEHLKANARNWRNEDDKLSSDCMVVLDDGTASSLVLMFIFEFCQARQISFTKSRSTWMWIATVMILLWSRNTMHAMEM